MTAWHDDDFADDDLAALSDDLDLFGDGTSEDVTLDAFAFDTVGDGAFDDMGMPLDPARVEMLTAHATGVRFEALVLFAQPLFDRYDVDPAEAFALVQTPDEADEAVVTLLETARLLWAYFTLDPGMRAAHRRAILGHCYGPDADAEAWEDFADLLDAMERAWDALPPEERAEAEATDAVTLDFEVLLAHTAPAEAAGRECDARALFALPLLDDHEVQTDPARFEAALTRADAYWSLAQQPDREAALDALVANLAPTTSERAALREEATRMLARFDELFG